MLQRRQGLLQVAQGQGQRAGEVRGPDRSQTLQATADEFAQGTFPIRGGRDLQGDTGSDGRIHGDNGGQLRQLLGGTQDDRSSWYLQTHRAPLRGEVGKELRAGAQLVPGQKSGQQ